MCFEILLYYFDGVGNIKYFKINKSVVDYLNDKKKTKLDNLKINTTSRKTV